MRVPLLLLTAFALTACRDTTKQEYTPTYSLVAYTTSLSNPSPTDSILCQVVAQWPSTEPIVPPWSGTVKVSAWRARRSDPLLSNPSRTGSAVLTLAPGSGDSVRVTLSGDVNLSLDGRMPTTPYSQAAGQWTCGADSQLSGATVPGEARGVWYLSRDYLID